MAGKWFICRVLFCRGTGLTGRSPWKGKSRMLSIHKNQCLKSLIKPKMFHTQLKKGEVIQKSGPICTFIVKVWLLIG